MTKEQFQKDNALIKTLDGELIGLLTEEEFEAFERCIARGSASSQVSAGGFAKVKFHG